MDPFGLSVANWIRYVYPWEQRAGAPNPSDFMCALLTPLSFVWPASHHGYVSTVTGVFSVYIHIVLDGLRILEPSSTKALLLRGVRCLVSVRCVVLVR